MPSNALKISQLIHLLEGMRGFHGDLDVVFASVSDSALIAVDERNVNVEGEAFGQKLPEPVLIIGLARDNAGRLRNMPGERFAASADASEWTYDINAAPEGADLSVWKRRGGQDVGRRIGDRWFVREGADAWPARPVEIIPAGILGWKQR